MNTTIRAAIAGAAALFSPALGHAQGQPIQVPTIEVRAPAGGPSLTQPSVREAQRQLELVPGAAKVIPSEDYEDTAAATLKEVLDYTPGVFIQPKWGEDARLSIRGSGLSRNFHLRGVQLLQDGVPVNHADGSGDFQELDPTGYRFVEVHKGANAWRYGTNSLGGAINFVSPTGHEADAIAGRLDLGSFGFRRLRLSSGGVRGDLDGYLSVGVLEQRGFRDHSAGQSIKANGNVGWRISDDLETRFFLNAVDIHQEIPGSVTREAALHDRRRAAANNERLDYERNIEAYRLSNKTAYRSGRLLAEAGGSASYRELIHPIFQYIDYKYQDFGLFGRLTHDHRLLGRDNRLVLGVTQGFGWVANRQYQNLAGGLRGGLLSKSKDRSTNTVLYAEDSLKVTPDLTVVAGLHYLRATRERTDEFQPLPNTGGSASYTPLNPKLGFVWSVNPDWRVFGNLSRSSEVPTFSELNFANAAIGALRPQRATTYEIGTAGRVSDLEWDLALYRANLRNEFQFFSLGGGNFSVVNAQRTVHQGVEAALDWAALRGILLPESKGDAVRLKLAYTLNDFYFDDDPVWRDNALPGAPMHFLRAALLYEHPSGLTLGPNVEWVPEGYDVDNANSQKTASYALFGFEARYRLNEHVSGYLEARNLFDTAYIASASVAGVATPASALYEPGPGRALFMGVKLRW